MRAENEMIVDASHASLYHWLEAGAGTHHHRGEWLIPRVFTVPGEYNGGNG
jgi:hypothetical protein